MVDETYVGGVVSVRGMAEPAPPAASRRSGFDPVEVAFDLRRSGAAQPILGCALKHKNGFPMSDHLLMPGFAGAAGNARSDERNGPYQHDASGSEWS